MRRLEFGLLSFPEFCLDGRPVGLALRKAAALLIYLAETGRPVAREVAATLLWPDADSDTGRTRLRRTLDKIRVAFGERLVVSRESSLAIAETLAPGVDAQAFEAACDAGDLRQADALYRGDYLAGFSLPDCPEFEEWVFFRREALRSRRAQLLERLTLGCLSEGDPRAAIRHAVRLVEMDPLSESGHRHLFRSLIAAGDRVAAERQLADFTSRLADELGVGPDRATLSVFDEVPRDEPPTRYVAVDGIHLAYRVFGAGDPDVVLVPGFISHVERLWDDPRCRAWIDEVARIARLIVFDRRGMGLSDRVGARPTVAATASDILAVMNAAGSRRAVLVGASEGGPGSIRFAVTHPDRLAGLVLWGAMAKGCRSDDYAPALTCAQYGLWTKSLVAGWGGPAGIETFAPSLSADRQARAWWAGLLRAASSPGAVAGVLEALRDSDVRNELGRVITPTRILHRIGDRAVRIEAGRDLARRIPGADFLELAGDDHWFWAGDTRPLLDAIAGLLRRSGPARPGR
jgi:DNA-binding SARP family transcriptional activator/pimeloyl-ACP methyl ester carboxylesterase